MVHEVPNIQTNFTSGEVDPMVYGRIDTAAYANGLARALNTVPLNSGGITRRPGTAYVVGMGSTYQRLIPFEYSEHEQFIIALGGGMVRVFFPNGVLMAQFVGPWPVEYLDAINYSQLGNTVVFVHESVRPHVLSRANATTWVFGPFAFERTPDDMVCYQPYEKVASNHPVTLTLSHSAGFIQIHASHGIFLESYIGTRLRIFDNDVTLHSLINPFDVNAIVHGVIKGRMQTNPFRTLRGTQSIEVTHVGHGLQTGQVVAFSNVNDIMTLAYSGSGTTAYSNISADSLNGAHSIVVMDQDTYHFAINLGTGLTGPAMYQTVDGGGPDVRWEIAGHPIRNWMEQVMSPARGWPRAVAFHDQRLWFGGTPSKPDGLWSSSISRYFNFDVGDGQDHESIQVSIGSDLGSVIRHLMSNRHLQVFTSTSELYCKPPDNSTLTPSTFQIQMQTRFGSNYLRPVSLDGGTIYIQSNNKTVREHLYSDAEQAYSSTSISLLGAHLITTPKDIAVLRSSATRGEQVCCIINIGGECAVFVSARSEKVAGWVPWTTLLPDQFSSVCSLGNTFYFSSYRRGIFFLERMNADDNLTIDGAVTFRVPSETNFFNLGPVFSMRTVDVLGGEGRDFYMGRYTLGPEGFLFTGDRYASVITVGYGFNFHLKTLPPSVETPRGKRAGSMQRIAEATVLFNETTTATVQGERLITRRVHTNVEATPPKRYGAERFYFRGYSREPSIEITQAEPLSLKVLYIRSKVVA